MSEINHPYSGNERNVLLTWFRGIRVSDTQCPRSASAPYLTHHFQSINFCSFYPLLLYHPSLRLGLCHLHRPGLQSWPHLNPSQRQIVSWSNSFKDSPRPAVENPAPKPSPPRFPSYLNAANFSAPESNLGSLRNADLRASAPGGGPGNFQQAARDLPSGWMGHAWGVLPSSPAACRNSAHARSLHSGLPGCSFGLEHACHRLLAA